jgi:hypothetical protein
MGWDGGIGACLFPVVDGLDVLVFEWLEAGWHVALPELFALVDVNCAGEGGLHEAEELGAELAVFVFVAAVARHGAGVVWELLSVRIFNTLVLGRLTVVLDE